MEEKKDIFDHLKPRETSVPDASYFEAMAKSVVKSQKKTPIIQLYKRPIVWIGAVAAVFIAGILIVNFNNTKETDSDPLLALNTISSDELYQYIDENIDDFDTELIVEVMNESSVDEMTINEPEPNESTKTIIQETTAEAISFDDVDSEDILQYLNNEGIDSDDFEDEDSFI